MMNSAILKFKVESLKFKVTRDEGRMLKFKVESLKWKVTRDE